MPMPVRTFFKACLGLGAVGAALAGSPSWSQTTGAVGAIEGRPLIVDGDTLEIGGRRVHLIGVDAPEPEQMCERGGVSWRCGAEATYGLASLIEHNWVTCRQHASDSAGEILATCRMGGLKGVSVNEELVRRGWALAVSPAGDSYRAAERQAKAAKVGLWSGTFAAPWEWRRGRKTGKTEP